jgi:hypothetical protein
MHRGEIGGNGVSGWTGTGTGTGKVTVATVDVRAKRSCHGSHGEKQERPRLGTNYCNRGPTGAVHGKSNRDLFPPCRTVDSSVPAQLRRERYHRYLWSPKTRSFTFPYHQTIPGISLAHNHERFHRPHKQDLLATPLHLAQKLPLHAFQLPQPRPHRLTSLLPQHTKPPKTPRTQPKRLPKIALLPLLLHLLSHLKPIGPAKIASTPRAEQDFEPECGARA